MFSIDTNFQTPPIVCEHMAKMALEIIQPFDFKYRPNCLEPSPGIGQLEKALWAIGFNVQAPHGNFWENLLSDVSFNKTTTEQSPIKKIHVAVMNPPFNPIAEMVRFVTRVCELSDNVIALLPWTYIINSENRLRALHDFGLLSITFLPRKTFPGCRVQVAIFELKKGYAGTTEFKRFNW